MVKSLKERLLGNIKVMFEGVTFFQSVFILIAVMAYGLALKAFVNYLHDRKNKAPERGVCDFEFSQWVSNKQLQMDIREKLGQAMIKDGVYVEISYNKINVQINIADPNQIWIVADYEENKDLIKDLNTAGFKIGEIESVDNDIPDMYTINTKTSDLNKVITLAEQALAFIACENIDNGYKVYLQ